MKTIKVGYARVSTGEDKQKLGLDLQKRALREQHCEFIFAEEESGTKDNRQEFSNAIQAAKYLSDEGYHVKFVVLKLDRLARHLVRSATVIDDLQHYGIQLVSLKENIDTSTPGGILQYQMLSMFAEFEVNQTRQRTRDALAELKKEGKVLGRPKIEPKVEKEVCRLYKLPEYPINKIAKRTGVGRSTVFMIAKRNNLTRRRKSMTIYPHFMLI